VRFRAPKPRTLPAVQRPYIGTAYRFPNIESRPLFASILEAYEPKESIPLDDTTPEDISPVDSSPGGRDREASTSRPSPLRYSVENLTLDRTYNANASSTAELADVLGTLLQALAKQGIVSLITS